MLDSETAHWARPTPQSLLGEVVHTIIERVERGDAAASRLDRTAWFNKLWQQEVLKAHRRLQDSWSPATVPDVRQWPGQAQKKVRLRLRLLRMITDDPEPRIRVQERSPAERLSVREIHVRKPNPSRRYPLPIIEQWIVDEGLGLGGKPDLVEERNGRLRVVDQKTGDITASMERYRFQLLFYAHLCRVALGRLPDDLVLSRVDGSEVAMTFTALDVDAVVKHACKLAMEWEPGRCPVACPSADTCRFCPFQVECQPMADAWEADSGWDSILVAGVCQQTRRRRDGLEILVRQDRPRGFDAAEVRMVGLSPQLKVEPGDTVVATGVSKSTDDVARVNWNGRVRIDRQHHAS